IDVPCAVTARWAPAGQVRLCCPVPADGHAPIAGLSATCRALLLQFIHHASTRLEARGGPPRFPWSRYAPLVMLARLLRVALLTLPVAWPWWDRRARCHTAPASRINVMCAVSARRAPAS